MVRTLLGVAAISVIQVVLLLYGFAEEWRYLLNGRLVGVGYVDALPDGLSAIYYFSDPDERSRSLGTFNVLSIIEEAGRRGLPWVYLGYYVKGCRSVEYKARFAPNEVLGADGTWGPFVS